MRPLASSQYPAWAIYWNMGGRHDQMTAWHIDTSSTDILVGKRYRSFKLTSKVFFLRLDLLIFKLHYCVRVCVCAYTQMPGHTCGGRGQLAGASFLLLPVGSRDPTQDIRLSGKVLHSPNHLASSEFFNTLTNNLNLHTGKKRISAPAFRSLL